jgi:hypothetical protein
MTMVPTTDSQTGPGPEQEFPPSSSPEQVDRSFATGPRCRVTIENHRGRVHVSGWDRGEVHVRATKLRDGSNASRFDETRIEVSQRGDEVVIRTVRGDHEPPSGERGIWQELAAEGTRLLDALLGDRGPSAVDYEIRVPRQADLTVAVVEATTSIDGVHGKLRSRSISGPCELRDVGSAGGTIELQAVSGSIAGTGLVGGLSVKAVSGRTRVSGAIETAHVQTVSGSVELVTSVQGWADCDAKSVSGSMRLIGPLKGLRARAVSGSIELIGRLDPSGQYDLQTVSGSLTLSVPPETGISIEARGVSTSVSSDLPFEVDRDERQPGKRFWQGRVNGGGAPVRFQSVSGRLRVARMSPDEMSRGSAEPQTEEPAWPSPEASAGAPGGTAESSDERRRIDPAEAVTAPATPPSGDERADVNAGEPTDEESEQLRVLRAVERGELTVEEALRRLDAGPETEK